MSIKKTLFPLAAIFTLVSAFAACGDDKKGEAKPTATPVGTVAGGGGAAKVLPASYDRSCSSCHGADGVGAGSFPALKNTTLTEAVFVGYVKNGKGGGTMPAGLVSDAEAKEMLNYFKK